MPWCRGSGGGGDCTLPPAASSDTRPGDGVARRRVAAHPQAGVKQERSGGEEEPADGVQVGTPHSDLCLCAREDETASPVEFLMVDVFIHNFRGEFV